MNEAAALGRNLAKVLSQGSFPRSEALSLPRRVSERSSKHLTSEALQMMRTISCIADDLILSVLDERTAKAFSEKRDEAFSQYFEAMGALSALSRILVQPNVMERLGDESFCEMEAELRENGLAAFGAEVRDQAMFTVWTLRKIAESLRCNRMPEPDVAHRKEVAQSLKEFVFYAMWTRFHLDCLFKSLQNDRRLYPGILAEIVDGLRAAVNAYAWVRRAIDLRSAPGEEELNFLTWDEEDQALLDEANRDPILEV